MSILTSVLTDVVQEDVRGVALGPQTDGRIIVSVSPKHNHRSVDDD